MSLPMLQKQQRVMIHGLWQAGKSVEKIMEVAGEVIIHITGSWPHNVVSPPADCSRKAAKLYEHRPHANYAGGRRPVEETHDMETLLSLLCTHDKESSQEIADRYRFHSVLTFFCDFAVELGTQLGRASVTCQCGVCLTTTYICVQRFQSRH